jgi:hypothetical protein
LLMADMSNEYRRRGSHINSPISHVKSPISHMSNEYRRRGSRIKSPISHIKSPISHMSNEYRRGGSPASNKKNRTAKQKKCGFEVAMIIIQQQEPTPATKA